MPYTYIQEAYAIPPTPPHTGRFFDPRGEAPPFWGPPPPILGGFLTPGGRQQRGVWNKETSHTPSRPQRGRRICSTYNIIRDNRSMIIGFGLILITMIIGATPSMLPYSQWGFAPWVRYNRAISAAAGEEGLGRGKRFGKRMGMRI